MQLYYASRDGQSRRIAERIAGRLAETGLDATPRDLAAGLPTAAELAAQPLVLLVAAVRYGHHLAAGEQFLSLYATLPSAPPLVFLSVNLTARKPGKDTATGNAYLRKSIARHNLKPVLARAIAGRLDYPLYGWRDRQIIRFIMLLTGGPTDPKAQVDYTPWAAVDDLGTEIAGLVGRGKTRETAR
jgi:menaquinone-dependent protoporphyrinogen oxidase